MTVWHLVPIPPTDDMLRAGATSPYVGGHPIAHMYNAMVLAAPEPPNQDPVGYVNDSFRDALLKHKGSEYWHGQMVCGKPFRGGHPLYLHPVPEDARVLELLKDVTASLAAAVSLLERSPKVAAPSNKMFDIMLNDYRGSLERARAFFNGGTDA